MTTAFTLVLVAVFAALSSFVQRVTGFGFGIVMMTMLPYIMPSYGEATALSGILAACMALIPAVTHRRYVRLGKLLPILLTFLVLSFFSVKVLTVIDGHSLKRWFGVALIVVSIDLFFFSDKVRLKPTMPVQISLGALSGLLGGMFAMQGPPAVVYFMASSESKDEYIAATQWYFVTGNLMMTLFRWQSGFVSHEVLHSALIALPAVALGLWVGAKVYGRLHNDHLRRIVYLFLAVAGVVSVVL